MLLRDELDATKARIELVEAIIDIALIEIEKEGHTKDKNER